MNVPRQTEEVVNRAAQTLKEASAASVETVTFLVLMEKHVQVCHSLPINRAN